MGGQGEFGDGDEDLRRRGILQTRMRRRTSRFIAEDGIQTFDTIARLAC